mmetsp:Transcript_35654/g.72671  ORF Transcript_35654/g.72671 Transcript_35654/m.72671 type:complete len:228 (-) Transcript_35654:126-809(-)
MAVCASISSTSSLVNLKCLRNSDLRWKASASCSSQLQCRSSSPTAPEALSSASTLPATAQSTPAAAVAAAAAAPVSPLLSFSDGKSDSADRARNTFFTCSAPSKLHTRRRVVEAFKPKLRSALSIDLPVLRQRMSSECRFRVLRPTPRPCRSLASDLCTTPVAAVWRCRLESKNSESTSATRKGAAVSFSMSSTLRLVPTSTLSLLGRNSSITRLATSTVIPFTRAT